MTGLQVMGIRKSLEAYCDNVNVVTDNLEDFKTVIDVVGKFESVSGAILSRNKKMQGHWVWKLGGKGKLASRMG